MGGWYQCGYYLSKVIARSLFSFEVVHRERIIEEGPAILAMNHQSFLDPPLAGIACRREIYFLARRTLLEWPILGPILPKLNVIPVDQVKADMSALKAVIRLVRAGQCTVIFPEGARTANGELQAAQPGLGLVIAKTKAPVVPMRIFGAHEAFPRGSRRVRRHPITLVVGHSFRFTDEEMSGSGRELYQRLSDQVMGRIAQIRLDS